MLYTRFEPMGPDAWAVLNNAKQVAKIVLRGERCTISTNRTLSRAELAVLLEFVAEHSHSPH